MRAVLLRARSELRARWRAWLALTLMLGIFGGAVIAIAAGARRTDSAYPRFLRWSRAWDVAVPRSFGAGSGVGAKVDLSKVEHLPQVEASSRLRIFNQSSDISANAPDDSRTYVSLDRPKVLAGRLPRSNAPNEVALNWLLARRLGVGVGDTLPQRFIPRSNGHPILRLNLHVVGIEAAPGGFPPTLTDTPGMIMSRAFDLKYRAQLANFLVSYVRLKHGFADIPQFLTGVRRLAHNKPLFTLRQDTQAANVEWSFHLQALALWLLAGLTGLVMLLVIGQTLARQIFLESDENPTLRSLGMTRSQLVAAALIRALAVVVLGAALAAIVAALMSPLFPTGLARVAEPDPGFHLDPTTLVVGALGIVLVIGLLLALPAWRSAKRVADRDEAEGERSSLLASALGRTMLPPSGRAGVRMALEPGRGHTAVPVRTTIASVSVGIATLLAALTFGASLTHLLGTPSLYGVTWDVQVYANQQVATQKVARELVSAARAAPGVAAFGLGTAGVSLSVDGIPADGVAVYERPDGVEPPILSGRAPSAPREIALGPKTLEQLHKHVGDTVNVGVFEGGAKPMRIVGEAVTPPVGDVGRFGKGAIIDYSAAQYLVPGAPAADTLLVRTMPGADPMVVGRDIASKVPIGLIQVTRPVRPNDLVNFGRVQDFPLYLAGLVGLMAVATLAHVLVTSIRRRRRDLAILKTLGFQRGQLAATLAWQASVLVFVALLIGLPVGVAAGRWIWSAFANSLGILPSSAIPFAAVALAVPVTLLLANLIAYLPGRAAARVQPSAVLRTE